MLKILLVGAGNYEIHEPALGAAFRSLGYQAELFSWTEFFEEKTGVFSFFPNFFLKVQKRICVGPTIRRINEKLSLFCNSFCPDLVFVYRNVYIDDRTVVNIQKSGARVFIYNNDDPFSGAYPLSFKLYWRLYKKSLKVADHSFVFRHKNIKDCEKIGLGNVSLLRGFYLKSRIFEIPKIGKSIDVLFIGHYEPDRREDYIFELIKNKINFRLYGVGWSSSKFYTDICAYLGYDPSRHLHGPEYNKMLNNAKIALVFLSKLNNDTYTTRCFEIPAAKTMMLCQRTQDMESMFAPGVEAVYFSTISECLEKINYYLADDRYKPIAFNGYNRLKQDGHEASDRCVEIIKVFSRLNNTCR